MAREFIKQFTQLPMVLRAGLVIFSSAGCLDLLYHTFEAAGLRDWVEALERYIGPDAYLVHVLLFIGMVVMWLGTLTVRRSADETIGGRWPHQPELSQRQQSVQH